ncbi:FAD-binding oxidoreductase [Gammaproteobacteria bacterium]|nr:FAD-binding oxidoreductase [Gammaproteobacteria bacterium]
MNSNTMGLIDQLAGIVGVDAVKTGSADLNHFGKDWTKVYVPDPAAIVFPSNIEQVQDIVKLAHKREVALVPSGGRTGLSGGAVAEKQELVVSFDRMNKILSFDAVDRQVVCQPGVITEQLQEFATNKDLFYPIDFASSGSSQLGGNVATNAGGIKVIRYGMTRNWILGMKVVTGTGEVLDLNRGLTKNATGYDFRHLFIGSEGTLGFIVELTLALCSKPNDPTVLLLSVERMVETMEVLKAFQNRMELTAFEFFSDKAMQYVIEEKGLQRPFELASEFYVLIEFEKVAEQDIKDAIELFEHCLEQGWISDGIISHSAGQADSLWRLREDISETISKFTPYKNDISVKVSQVPSFLEASEALVSEAYPDFEIIWFGHIGDGNLHLNILKPANLAVEDFYKRCDEVSERVFDLVRKFGGSISAEHGIGMLKKPYLHYSRGVVELDYMKAIKQVFDPQNIMNPGKLVDL